MTSLSIVMRSRNGELQAETMAAVDMTSSGEDSDEIVQPWKKRKSTYYSRKDEIETLHLEEKKLVEEIARLEDSKNASEVNKLQASVEKYAELQHAAQQTAFITAGARSMLNSSMGHNPLNTYIHLTADPLQRELALQATREPHINKVIPYILERARFQNLRRSSRQSDTKEAANGDLFFDNFDVTSFAEVKCTLTQLYDETVWLTRHQEFIMFENFGVSSFLEVDTCDENLPATSQARILSTVADDLVLEKNVVIMRSFNPHGSEILPAPHAVIAIESVDLDELYPYQPATRMQLYISCVMLLIEVPPDHPGDTTSVSVIRACFKKLLKPHFPLAIHQQDRVQEIVTKWGEILCKTARANLLAKAPQTNRPN